MKPPTKLAYLENLMRFIFLSFTILFILIGIKVPVHIIDMQEPMVAHKVDDIPLGVALPAAFVSSIGRGISQEFEDVFHMPDDMGYNKTGMIFGSRIALATKSANFGVSPNLSADLSNYMRQCIIISKIAVAHKITVSDLLQSSNLTTQLFENASPVYRVILSDAGNVSCQTAAINLKNRLVAAADKEAQQYANSFTKGDKAKFDSSLSNAQNYFMGISEKGTSLLVQNMLINKVRSSVSDAMAFNGDTAGMMNYANTSAMNNLRMAEANSFWMAGYRLPMINACLWILIMCLFPVVILLGFFPAFEKAYSSFIKTMIWIWTWPPMFTILHFFVSYYASIKTNIFGVQSGGITMSNANPIAMIHSDMAFTAGLIAMAIPFLAKGITTGFAEAFSSVSQLLGSYTHSAAQGVTSGLSHGNVSVGNMSGWNANYDNTSAHKHDINSTDYRGMSTHQLDNGATVTSTPSGQQIINTSGAMSQMAVGIHGSEALVSSLTNSAQTAQHRGESLRTSADNSLNSAMREGSTFNSSDSNDYRVGGGISDSD
jgi:conjugal transfer mating pair stabilization protein TraG